MTDTLLVTGASGNLGQRVLGHLLDALNVPADQVIAVTRNPDRLASWRSRGVVVRAADFDDEASLLRAFQGADRMLLISTDSISVDSGILGRRVEQHLRAIVAAEQVGIAHLIYTSMPEPKRSLILFAPDHSASEDAVAASLLPGWTVLRNHWYFENLFMYLPGALARGGKWLSAAGDGKCADISRDDLALAAASELASRSMGRRICTISGSEAMTTDDQVKLISFAIGKPIHVVPVSIDAIFRAAVAVGVPEHVAQVLASIDANIAAGRMGSITGDFEKITGRKAQSLARWLDSNRAAMAAHGTEVSGATS